MTGTILLYAVLDISTTLMYHDVGYDWAVKDINELSEIVLSKVYTKKDIAEALNINQEIYYQYWQEDEVPLNDAHLVFRNDTLIKIIGYK